MAMILMIVGAALFLVQTKDCHIDKIYLPADPFGWYIEYREVCRQTFELKVIGVVIFLLGIAVAVRSVINAHK